MAGEDESRDDFPRKRLPVMAFVAGAIRVLLLVLLLVPLLVWSLSFSIDRGPRGVTGRMKVTKARGEVNEIRRAVQIFYIVQGRLPLSLHQLRSPQKDYEEGILDIANDPWGHPYEYTPGAHRGFTIRCLGADGAPGGEGEAADIVLVEPGRPPPAPK